MPPVAVLTNGNTASAGEAVAISFRGRPSTRSFGSPTYGVPTANTFMKLSDGASILVTTAREADRTGRVYGIDEKLQPDQQVSGTGYTKDGADDTVVRAA